MAFPLTYEYIQEVFLYSYTSLAENSVCAKCYSWEISARQLTMATLHVKVAVCRL